MEFNMMALATFVMNIFKRGKSFWSWSAHIVSTLLALKQLWLIINTTVPNAILRSELDLESSDSLWIIEANSDNYNCQHISIINYLIKKLTTTLYFLLLLFLISFSFFFQFCLLIVIEFLIWLFVSFVFLFDQIASNCELISISKSFNDFLCIYYQFDQISA